MKIFNDEILNTQFNEKGYVVVDFLNQEEVQILLNFLDKTNYKPNYETYTSVHLWEPDVNDEFSKLMTGISQPKIDTLMSGWFVQGASFIIKGAKSVEKKTNFSLHQDFNMVDESDLPSLGLWVPLVDTDHNNGGLCVLPGSHKVFGGTIRGANLPSLYLDIDPDVNSLLDHLVVNAGQACIFAHSLFHGSPNNNSQKHRPIIHAGLFSPTSRQFHFYLASKENEPERIEVLEIDRTFYYREILNFIKDPKASPHKVVGSVYSYRKKPTRQEILDLYGYKVKKSKETVRSKSSFLTRLSNIFRLFFFTPV